ncbi:hypothetical protein GCM10010226_12910 [Streptomyces phaeofaciens]|uniref:Uncharacterized protein n=1 Tax=Streptomyces phaeofaciens TaxID=68254 RepID=A0A918H6T7_9ACTN|nr:hypothetical protein GCM10010226_12910 [Streptomyces phaeofaciens]
MVKGPVQVPLTSRVSPGEAAVMAGCKAPGLALQFTAVTWAAAAGATPVTPAAPAATATVADRTQRRRRILTTSMRIWLLLAFHYACPEKGYALTSFSQRVVSTP